MSLIKFKILYHYSKWDVNHFRKLSRKLNPNQLIEHIDTNFNIRPGDTIRGTIPIVFSQGDSFRFVIILESAYHEEIRSGSDIFHSTEVKKLQLPEEVYHYLKLQCI